MSICQIEAICFVIGPLLRAWECFSEEIRDTLARVPVRRIVKAKSRVLNEKSATSRDLKHASFPARSKFVELLND